MAADILDEKRHAAKRTVAEQRFIERIDAVVIKLDDGVDGRIDGGDRIGGDSGELARRDLASLHKLGQSEAVKAGVFVDSHYRKSLRVDEAIGNRQLSELFPTANCQLPTASHSYLSTNGSASGASEVLIQTALVRV